MPNFTKLYVNQFASVLAVFVIIAAAALAPFAFAAETSDEIVDDVPNIVVFGDSLVAGYLLPQGDGFPDKLQATFDAKGIPAKFIGAGVSGDTTSSGLARLDWSVQEGTDAVLLELGANDALRGIPPQNTRANLDAILTRLQERNIKVLLVGMLAPPNMGEDYAAQYNPIFPELAEKFDVPLYPFFLDGVLTKPEHLLDDAMHPNSRGVEVMVGKILPMVETLVEELRPTP